MSIQKEPTRLEYKRQTRLFQRSFAPGRNEGPRPAPRHQPVPTPSPTPPTRAHTQPHATNPRHAVFFFGGWVPAFLARCVCLSLRRCDLLMLWCGRLAASADDIIPFTIESSSLPSTPSTSSSSAALSRSCRRDVLVIKLKLYFS